MHVRPCSHSALLKLFVQAVLHIDILLVTNGQQY